MHGGGFLSMSKKRFDCKGDYSNGFILDTEGSGEYLNVKEITEILNSLNDENKLFKTVLSEVYKELNDDYDIAVKGGMSSGGVVFALDILNQIYKRVGWDSECSED